MSYIEFFGTALNIWCVYLTTRAKILSWPIGLLGSALYLLLFYQIQLYSDLFEQVYFIITGFTGWYAWLYYKKEINKANDTVIVGINAVSKNLIYIGIIISGTGILSLVTMNLSVWLPKYFPEPVSYPVLDAATTVMSFIAQWLLVRKKVESWVLWILVDIIGIWLYWVKGVKLVSIEYVFFLIMASYGLYNWLKIHNNKKTYDQAA
jgi:nicotinamide mononucleotide transporter